MKFKYTFLLTLIGVLPQLTVASDLDDAVNFANGKFRDCLEHSTVTSPLSSFSEKYLRQEIQNSILYVNFEIRRYFEKFPPSGGGFESMVDLKNLNSTVKTETFPSQGSNTKPRYYISFECADGKKCINYQRHKLVSGDKTLSSDTGSEGFVGVCSESDMNRAAKALSDAIRLSGGKTSKY